MMEMLVDRGSSWERIIQLLASEASGDVSWRESLDRLCDGSQATYADVLRLLTHLELDEDEARRHWAAIDKHRQHLGRRLGHDVGLRVAVLDYFTHRVPLLHNPKVMEIERFLATERNALTDHLTGLFNRQYFDTSLRRETKRAQRYGLTFSLVLLDLDDFKEVNDHYGHQAGDRALVMCADAIRASVREIDIACRYGGEEFALILPETSRAGAYIVSERIRIDLANRFRSTAEAGCPVGLSVSGGVAIFPTDASTEEALVGMADRALYRSKRDGKNRVTLHAEEKRRSPRFEAKKPLTVENAFSGAPDRLASITKNLSRNGALVESRVPLGIGSELSVRIRQPSRDYVFKGKVVRLEEVKRGSAKCYDVGIAFMVENEDQSRELDNLAEEIARPLSESIETGSP